ncbi:phosphorylase superfamily protein, partial [Colletotrichum musicola]
FKGRLVQGRRDYTASSSPPSPSLTPTLQLTQGSIVLVHGLRGHPRHTWESVRVVATNDNQGLIPKKRNGLGALFKSKRPSPNPSPSQPQDISPPSVFWPDDYLTEDLPETRVWTYGYNADVIGGLFQANNQNSVSQHGRDLKAKIEREVDNNVLVTQLCREKKQSADDDLRIQFEVLDNIHEEFKTVVQSRNIKVHSFQEAKGIAGMKGLHNKVVDDFSSKLDLPQSLETVESIDANHMEMARCSSKDDERYRAIIGVLRQFLRGDALARVVNAVHHVIHFTRNKRYVQRAESSDIQHMFFDQRQQTVALVGMGGVGKTQLALDFAYWVKENKPAYSVFWVPAFSFAGFEQAYTDIAKELGLRPNTEGEDVKTTVRQFLNSKAAGCWLLIVDNADDMDIFYGSAGEQEQNGLINHIPTSDNGIILFTTRSREVALAVADDAPIDLLAMEKDEAETLLGKSIHRKQLLQDHDTVAKLLDFLTYLPLAITQASAYLNRNTSLSITRYLELLQGTEDTLIRTMSREFRDSTRYSNSSNAIATTWLVSFEQIRQIDSHAADLLYFVSRIEPKSIPRSILPCSGSKEELEYAIGTLTSYAFIFERDETQTFDMHSLVHLATRVWVAKESIDQQIKADATKHLNKIFPTDHYTNRALWRQYMPHALKNLKESTEPEIEEMLDLSSQVGRCLLEDARTQEAIKLLEHVVEVREETLDEGHPSRLASQHNLAKAYQADGRVKEVIKLLEHVVEVRENTLDEGHPSRLASQHNLATAYQADGRVKEAVKLLEHVVEVQENTLDEGHPSRLASQHTLATAYEADGRVKEAIELLEHVVEVQESTLDEVHPSRLASQQVLARAYEANGRVKEAIELLEHVVEVQESTLDEGHPHRLASQQVLARAYEANGRVKEAIELLEHVVEVQESTLDTGHPHRLTSQHNLAYAYQADGRVKEAIELLEHVVEVQESTLDEGH